MSAMSTLNFEYELYEFNIKISMRFDFTHLFEYSLLTSDIHESQNMYESRVRTLKYWKVACLLCLLLRIFCLCVFFLF